MNVGLIGAGHIAHALAEGWRRQGIAERPSLTFFDVDGGKARDLAAESDGVAAATAAQLVAEADLVIVAVRPQYVEGVLHDIGPGLGTRTLVSVAAGVTLARLRAALPAEARVGRVMPNIAAALGLGVFLFLPGTLGADAVAVERLFALAGDVVELDEGQFDVATAVAGCMPGIIGHFVEAFAAAGEAHGLADDVAVRLAIAGVYGAAAIVAREGDPSAVVAATATPGGMTAAAVEKLMERELATTVALAVTAAVARAKELA